MQEKKAKLLHITGTHRCGSTILDRLLGQLEGFFSTGELQYLWEEGFLYGRSCSCGQPVLHCEVWSRIIAESIGTVTDDQARQWLAFRKQNTRVWMALDSLNKHYQHRASFQQYLHVLAKIYQAIINITGCRVIVDSSKYPLYLPFFRQIPFLDVYILHLVRDSRAVAYSMMTPKDNPDPHNPNVMDSTTLWTSALVWNLWNLLAEHYGRKSPERYLLLRYEDFVTSPKMSLQTVLNFLGENVSFASLFTDHKQAVLRPTHTIAGNPVRFQEGALTINRDSRWQEHMSPTDKLSVTLFTWPLLIRYGYLQFRKKPPLSRQSSLQKENHEN